MMGKDVIGSTMASSSTFSPDPILAVHGLGKRFGRRMAVEDLTFSLAPGEILGFLGPNGAGKSTTLRMLLGLVRPTSGSFRLLGETFPGGHRRVLAGVGALVERADLYPQLSARDNLRWLGRLQGVRDERRVEEVLAQVGLAARAGDRVKVYSQGMKQRLGLAQAILHRPRLLLLDEPMTGLDPAGMRRMRDWIRRLAGEEGMAVLFSSHLLGEVHLLADRLLVLHRGRRVADGEPGTLFERHGGRRWEILCRDRDRARQILARVPGLCGLEERGGRLAFQAPDLDAPALVAQLAAADLGLAEFRPRDSLEDLLFSLAGGEEPC